MKSNSIILRNHSHTNLKIQSKSIFLEHFKETDREVLIEIYSFLMELQKELF